MPNNTQHKVVEPEYRYSHSSWHEVLLKHGRPDLHAFVLNVAHVKETPKCKKDTPRS